MTERFIICNWDFLGAGDRNALATTAQQLSGQPPIILDMQRMASKDLSQSRAMAQTIAEEIRAAAGEDKIIFISSGIDYIHPIAHELKNSLNAEWLDVRLDLDNGQSFKNYPKQAERFQPVDHAVELKNTSVGMLGTIFSKIFNSASKPERGEITTVPVTPDLDKISQQAARFEDAHPSMTDNAVIVLLGSYIQNNTKSEIDKIVSQAQTEGRPVIIVTSPRTEKQQGKIVDHLEQKYGDRPGIHLHRFSADNPDGNIYPGVLAFAKDVAVTSDSLTMVSESIAMGLRTHILPTMADRPAHYESLQQKNLVRMVKGGLDTHWIPSSRPDPFVEIRTAMDSKKSDQPALVNSGLSVIDEARMQIRTL